MRRTKKKFPGLRGAIDLLIILIVIIVGGIVLAGGIFPKVGEETSSGGGRLFRVIDETSSDAQKSLQLKSLQFQEIPQPTQDTPKCTQTVAVNLLVDTSGSMDGTKIGELKRALKAFTGPLSDDSVILLQQFSTTPTELISFSLYKDVKQQIPSIIDSLQAGGWTHTRDAFVFVKDRLSRAQNQSPDRQFSLIFFSDGVPQTEEHTRQCGGERCFDPSQDPTIPPDIAAEIKNSGVRIFSIALLDESDQRFNAQLQQLMQNVASPNSYHQTFNESDLTKIYQEIGTSICQ